MTLQDRIDEVIAEQGDVEEDFRKSGKLKDVRSVEFL